MTVRVFIHSTAKRAETISLLDSGATKNFLNLEYAKWLRLPIKRMTQPRKLFNVDGTENKAGQLQYYTDLTTRTGSTTTNMRSGTTPILHRLNNPNRINHHKHEIFPHRTRRTQGYTRIPLVCSHPTKNRLEKRMD